MQFTEIFQCNWKSFLEIIEQIVTRNDFDFCYLKPRWPDWARLSAFASEFSLILSALPHMKQLIVIQILNRALPKGDFFVYLNWLFVTCERLSVDDLSGKYVLVTNKTNYT